MIDVKRAGRLRRQAGSGDGAEQKSYMKMIRDVVSPFFREYHALAIGQQPVAQLGSMDNLIEKVPQAAAQLLEAKDFPFVQEPVAQIPWGHNILLMEPEP